MREKPMGKGWRCRSICLHILFIAMALQAMTPDIPDRASPSLPDRLLLPAIPVEAARDGGQVPAQESAPIDGDRSPSRDGDRDEKPDESCLPARYTAGSILPRYPDDSPLPGFVPLRRDRPSTRPEDRGALRFHVNLSLGYDVILSLSLCHLTC
jgi:hypothetical protein